MLNGTDPIIIFQLGKLPAAAQKILAAKTPLVASALADFALVPIPLYLSEDLTGVYVDTQTKTIDIDTQMESLTTGFDPLMSQKAISAITRVNLVANRDSIGIMLLGAVADQVVKKVTSFEYAISYLSGAVTILNGLLHSFVIDEEASTTQVKITIEISIGNVKKGELPQTPKDPEAANLSSGAAGPTKNLTPPLGGPSKLVPTKAPVSIKPTNTLG